ncbi:unnamed protein product [Trypanosoma congolense IL3000]|uniref:WGS project CAEQ00000000 data, annotated contig 610 n=1 Tax=Trypanosoma congolense (strain IL3000) TaxID=1068625 RepID=F9WH78_TRYCI|nr:unnamed protein product [Trypanosoma congolense IL3000]
MTTVTPELFKQQNDICNRAVIAFLRDDEKFKQLSSSEGLALIRRDKEDSIKLEEGIEIAMRRGTLRRTGAPPPAPLRRIDMSAKTTQEAVEEIMAELPGKKGNVIIVQGLSGTGKGTTVRALQQALPQCVTWSNGNVFRSYTHLLLEELKGELRAELLTPQLIQHVHSQVTFEDLGNGLHDIVLRGRLHVRDIENTVLKTPSVNNAVPTVAQQMQGEVICFAVTALEKLCAAGYNVILEGRSQTLDYIPSQLRFELFLEDPVVLGERRAAQRVMAWAMEELKDSLDTATTADVEAALKRAVLQL